MVVVCPVGVTAKYTEFLRDLEWVPGGWDIRFTSHKLIVITMVTVATVGLCSFQRAFSCIILSNFPNDLLKYA